MPDREYQELYDSIEELGVQNPITLLDGQVLDGWHRYTAAQGLGMDCPSVELAGWLDPRSFVLAQNKARRHVTQAQMAMATTAVYAWKPTGANQHEGRVDTECPPSKSTAELAEIAGVHASTIKQAKAVQHQGVPEVQAAVRDGAVGLPKAAAIAKLPASEQAAALVQPLAKKAKPEPEPQEVEQPAPDDYTELDEARDQITALQDELVVARLGSADPAAQAQAAEHIAALQAEVKTLQATLKATTLSRDTLLEERAQFLRQLKSQRSEIDRLKKQ